MKLCVDCGEWAAIRQPSLCLHCAYVRLTARRAFEQFTPFKTPVPVPPRVDVAAHFRKGLPAPIPIHHTDGKTWPELIAEAL